MAPAPGTVTVISCSTTMTSNASWPEVEKIVVRVDSAETSEFAGADVTAAIDEDVSGATDVATTGVEDGKEGDETNSTEAADVVTAASDVVITEVEDDSG